VPLANNVLQGIMWQIDHAFDNPRQSRREDDFIRFVEPITKKDLMDMAQSDIARMNSVVPMDSHIDVFLNCCNDHLLWRDLERLDSVNRTSTSLRRALEDYRSWHASCVERLEIAGYYIDACLLSTTPGC
jgi:hypothetical protein